MERCMCMPATRSDADDGVGRPDGLLVSGPFWFEEVTRLREDSTHAEGEALAREAQHTRKDTIRADLERALDESHRKSKDVQHEVDKLKRREAERSSASGKGTRDFAHLQQERDAIEDKMLRVEAVSFKRAEALTEANVDLFVEKKRADESAAMLREVREDVAVANQLLHKELRMYQRALLRAYYAHSGDDDTHRGLARLSSVQQVMVAAQWAEEVLPEVDAELMLRAEDDESAVAVARQKSTQAKTRYKAAISGVSTTTNHGHKDGHGTGEDSNGILGALKMMKASSSTAAT